MLLGFILYILKQIIMNYTTYWKWKPKKTISLMNTVLSFNSYENVQARHYSLWHHSFFFFLTGLFSHNRHNLLCINSNIASNTHWVFVSLCFCVELQCIVVDCSTSAAHCCRGYAARMKVNPLFNPKRLKNKPQMFIPPEAPGSALNTFPPATVCWLMPTGLLVKDIAFIQPSVASCLTRLAEKLQ